MNDYNPSCAPLKQCSGCKKQRPATLEYFHARTDRPSGLRSKCRECSVKNYIAPARKGYKRCTKCLREKPANSKHYRADTSKPDGLYSSCKVCVSEWGKEYREQYKDKIKSRKRAYHYKNLDAMTKRARQYYRQNRDEIIARVAKYRTDNPDKVREAQRKYSKKNRARINQQMRATYHRRRARKRNLPDHFTADDWQFALDYFNGRCAVCERAAGFFHTLAMDHWIPLSSPDCPGTVPENIVPLCHGVTGCNNSKGDKQAYDWLVQKLGKRKANQIIKRINTYFGQVR